MSALSACDLRNKADVGIRQISAPATYKATLPAGEDLLDMQFATLPKGARGVCRRGGPVSCRTTEADFRSLCSRHLALTQAFHFPRASCSRVSRRDVNEGPPARIHARADAKSSTYPGRRPTRRCALRVEMRRVAEPKYGGPGRRM